MAKYSNVYLSCTECGNIRQIGSQIGEREVFIDHICKKCKEKAVTVSVDVKKETATKKTATKKTATKKTATKKTTKKKV